MEQSDCVIEEFVAETEPPMVAHEASAPDMLALEPVMLNLEHSVKVHGRHQFFGWTQGLMQSLVPHELLICAARNGADTSFNVECFSMTPSEPARFSELLHRDSGILTSLVAAWEKNSFFPVVGEAQSQAPLGGPALWREIQRIGADTLVVHGTHDAASRAQSIFVFACRGGEAANREYFLRLIVPSLHAAWVRTQVNPATGESSSAAGQPASGGLTGREQEVLKWVYHGKSNYEIGMILSISPLTVKNHVQKILRKLNVQNRTQAVGKAMELRVLVL